MLRKWNGCVVIVIACLGVSVVPAAPAAAQPDDRQSPAQRCFGHHSFGASPVDAAKTADGRTVLARLSWGWHDSIGCYLTLDETATAVLRAEHARGPTAEGWFPDPVCRHEFRWWDGQAWTDRVGDRGQESADALRDGDVLAAPGASRDCTGAGWFPDPVCRHEFRWWDGQAWTDRVGDRGQESADPLLPSDVLAAPGASRGCAGAAPPDTAEPEKITLEQIPAVCAAPSPADEPGLGTGSDGGPCAMRLLSRSELAATGLFSIGPRPDGSWGHLQCCGDHMPFIPEAEALTYITECLRAEPPGGFPGPAESWLPRFPAEATALQTCNVLWQMTAGPINHAGMRFAARCVYGVFARHWHWGAYTAAHWDDNLPRVNYGWAEECGSWIDPEPDRTFLEKCHWLYGHYIGHDRAAGRIGAYDQCRAYNSAEGAPEWIAERGNCGDRYTLVRMALLFMHREARELGLLPDNGGIVDFMHHRPTDRSGALHLC